MSVPCAHPGCHLRVPPPRLVCKLHWSMLPRDVQDRVRSFLLAGRKIAAIDWLNDYYSLGK